MSSTTKKVVLAIIAILIIIGAIYLWQRSPAPAQTAHSGATSAQLANPASVNCDKLGGTLEIKNEQAGQVGYCHLPDGRVCEEWALFRSNTCTPPPTK